MWRAARTKDLTKRIDEKGEGAGDERPWRVIKWGRRVSEGAVQDSNGPDLKNQIQGMKRWEESDQMEKGDVGGEQRKEGGCFRENLQELKGGEEERGADGPDLEGGCLAVIANHGAIQV